MVAVIKCGGDAGDLKRKALQTVDEGPQAVMELTVNGDTRINLFRCSAKYQHVSSSSELLR